MHERRKIIIGFGAELSALLRKAPTLTGEYNMAYLAWCFAPSPKFSLRVNCFIHETLGETVALNIRPENI